VVWFAGKPTLMPYQRQSQEGWLLLVTPGAADYALYNGDKFPKSLRSPGPTRQVRGLRGAGVGPWTGAPRPAYFPSGEADGTSVHSSGFVLGRAVRGCGGGSNANVSTMSSGASTRSPARDSVRGRYSGLVARRGVEGFKLPECGKLPEALAGGLLSWGLGGRSGREAQTRGCSTGRICGWTTAAPRRRLALLPSAMNPCGSGPGES